MYAFFQRRLRCSAGAVPGLVELLHEDGVAFPRGGFPDLLDGDVASCADNVAHVDEVVAHEAILCDFSLLALKAIVESNDGARRSVRCWKDGRSAWFDVDVVIVVEAVDFECLVVIGLIMDVDVMHGFGIAGT